LGGHGLNRLRGHLRGTLPPVTVLPIASASHFVYILRCADGTLYTGYARDPVSRERAHNEGRGARYTRGRRPVALLYTEAFESRGRALKREHELKRWRRARKTALAQGFSTCNS
jgi:putative endonuclease